MNMLDTFDRLDEMTGFLVLTNVIGWSLVLFLSGLVAYAWREIARVQAVSREAFELARHFRANSAAAIELASEWQALSDLCVEEFAKRDRMHE